MKKQTTAEVLRMAVAGAEPALSDESATAIAAHNDLSGLSALAVSNRVAPWLAAAVSTRPELAQLPGLDQILRDGGAQTLSTLRLFAELSAILTKLNQEALPAVVLKGPVLGDSYYPDAGLRPYGDLDILVHESDLVAVSGILAERGYSEKNEPVSAGTHRLHEFHGIFQSIFINERAGSIVEVHCDHLQIGLEPVGMDEIWETASARQFGRGVARALEDHDMFVQLCVHLQRHGYERLIWLKDIDLMVRSNRLDWLTVESRARAQGCLGSVAYTLKLVSESLGTPLPVAAVELSRKHGRLSRWIFSRMWPVERINALEPQRQWRFRRLVQFAPETGFWRGGLPSLLMPGRRKDKLRVLMAALKRG